MLFRTKRAKRIYSRFFRSIGKPHIARIKPEVFFVNWFFQRILGINASVSFQVHYTSTVKGDKNMELAEWPRYCMAVQGGTNIVVAEGTKLVMGEDTIFAKNVCIRTANHDLMDRLKYNKASIIIGKNCWLAHGVAVMPGVTLGDNVTVGANSVVTKSFPDNVVIAGAPAKIIKTIS